MIRELLSAIGQIFTWFIAVAPWERCLRIRLGKHVKELGPGFYLKVPFVDRVYRQSVRRRLSVIRPQTLTTRDGRAISLSGAVGYTITDLKKLYNTLHDADDTIEAEVNSHIAEYVVTHDFAECRPALVQEHVRSKVDLAQYGLSGQEFFLTNFAAVRTLRIITGDLPVWARGSGLNTMEVSGPGAPR